MTWHLYTGQAATPVVLDRYWHDVGVTRLRFWGVTMGSVFLGVWWSERQPRDRGR